MKSVLNPQDLKGLSDCKGLSGFYTISSIYTQQFSLWNESTGFQRFTDL